ncbi:hypothetical protein CB1_000978012 [Camelus ferus]|nr:hypothetical protein CB1_000978012 [Camelus ferus]
MLALTANWYTELVFFIRAAVAMLVSSIPKGEKRGPQCPGGLVHDTQNSANDGRKLTAFRGAAGQVGTRDSSAWRMSRNIWPDGGITWLDSGLKQEPGLTKREGACSSNSCPGISPRYRQEQLCPREKARSELTGRWSDPGDGRKAT